MKLSERQMLQEKIESGGRLMRMKKGINLTVRQKDIIRKMKTGWTLIASGKGAILTRPCLHSDFGGYVDVLQLRTVWPLIDAGLIYEYNKEHHKWALSIEGNRLIRDGRIKI